MTKDKIYTLVLVYAVIVMITVWSWIAFKEIKESIHPQQMFNESIAARELGSLTMVEPKYTVYKRFQITHSTGDALMVNLVKFHCCNNIGGMVKDGELYVGFMNTTLRTQLGTTTKADVPELSLFTIVHELHHIVQMKHLSNGENPMTNKMLERTAYDFEGLLQQLISFEEDGHFSITKN